MIITVYNSGYIQFCEFSCLSICIKKNDNIHRYNIIKCKTLNTSRIKKRITFLNFSLLKVNSCNIPFIFIFQTYKIIRPIIFQYGN